MSFLSVYLGFRRQRFYRFRKIEKKDSSKIKKHLKIINLVVKFDRSPKFKRKISAFLVIWKNIIIEYFFYKFSASVTVAKQFPSSLVKFFSPASYLFAQKIDLQNFLLDFLRPYRSVIRSILSHIYQINTNMLPKKIMNRQQEGKEDLQI